MQPDAVELLLDEDEELELLVFEEEDVAVLFDELLFLLEEVFDSELEEFVPDELPLDEDTELFDAELFDPELFDEDGVLFDVFELEDGGELLFVEDAALEDALLELFPLPPSGSATLDPGLPQAAVRPAARTTINTPVTLCVMRSTPSPPEPETTRAAPPRSAQGDTCGETGLTPRRRWQWKVFRDLAKLEGLHEHPTPRPCRALNVPLRLLEALQHASLRAPRSSRASRALP